MYARIQSLSVVDGELRSLDLLNPTVREAVRDFTGTQVAALYESEHSTAYA